jgi:hypothetical protein
MKKSIFKILARANRLLLPRVSKADLNRLSAVQKLLVAYRYWVTVNALE